MPKVNLPMGLYGIFVPATDLVPTTVSGSGLSAREGKKEENKKESRTEHKPASSPVARADATEVLPGVFGVVPTGPLLLNLTKFLQQFASGPNAVLGGQFGAGMLAGFDVAYSGDGSAATLQLFETLFRNGQIPFVRNMSNTPQFVLTPSTLATADPSGYNVTFISLADYWLIGQNNPNTSDFLLINTSVTLYGITIYFGNK